MKKNNVIKPLLDLFLYGFILAVRAFLRRMPRRRALVFSESIGGILYHLVRSPRKTIEENLKFIYNRNMTGADMSRMTRRIFTFQVKTQVELMIYKNAEASRVSALMSIENQRLLDEALKPGKGILLLSAHLGDISLGVTRLAAAGYPVYVITRVLSNPYLYAYLNSIYAARRVTMIPRGEDSKDTYYRLLSENKILATAVDQHAQEKGVAISFLGKPAQAPCGWVMLARKSGARVLMCFCVKENDDHHRIIIEDPLVSCTGDKEKDLYDNTVKVNTLIERYIYAYPEQWFWMHKRWRAPS